MANTIANALLAIMALLVVVQVAFVALYVFRFKRNPIDLQQANPPGSGGSDGFHKEDKVAVVLCLRGADPGLASCLQSLSRQRYSNFQTHIVVDSVDDPALKVVNEFFGCLPDLQVYPIGKRYETCSLKCSAILTAVERIPESVQFIAFVDADTAPDRHWLCDLIAPFQDAGIGASTGDRWFESDRWSFGTALRQVWNAAAIVQMGIYNIAWGGSLAIRRELLRDSKLLDRWQHAFCEDTLLTHAMKSTGLKLARAPGLIVVNRETTVFFEAVNWITRQLVTVRLHNSNWPLIQAHAAATMSCNFALLLGLLLLIAGQIRLGWTLLAAFGIYQIVNASLLWLLQRVINRALDKRSVRNLQHDFRPRVSLAWTGLAILGAQWVYPYACLVATVCRRIRWRGIEYAIKGKGTIEMIEYKPFSHSSRSTRKDESDSIH